MTDAIDFAPYLAPSRGTRSGKWASAEEAIRAIPDGSRVFLAAQAGTPIGLVDELARQHDRYTRIEIITSFLMRRLAVFEHPGKPFWFVTTQANPAFKYLWDTGTVGILPAKYSDHSLLYRPDGPVPVDVALVTVSSPGPDGRVSLGVSVGGNVDAARCAPLVIAEVNPNMPYTFGVGEMSVDEFDFLVEIDEPVPEARPSEAADAEGQHIAALAAEHVLDGATIQFGIGALPDAILGHLRSRRDLTVHSGMVNEACRDLYEAGVVTGPMVAAEVVSTPDLLSWVDRNPAVLMGPAAYTHGAPVLGGLARFTAINSTVEVALDGACNSETAGGRVISGPGGAPDFAFGASVCPQGVSIIALRATAGGGRVSRIVPAITPPNRVTIPSYLGDVFVTEHGVAQIRGSSLDARARELTAIAAPDHRAALRGQGEGG